VLYSALYSTTLLEEAGGNIQTLKEMGMGKVSTWTMFQTRSAPETGVRGLVANSFLANIGQLIFSFAYFSYNRMFTILSGSREWESYAGNRKGLRVTGKPRGAQKTTYFLALPYRIAIPLLTLSGALHWLVSQSIYLVVVEYRYYDGHSRSWTRKGLSETENSADFRCGISPLAIIVLLATVFFMLLSLLLRASLRLKGAMPVAGNCSLAIATASHVSVGEDGYETAISKVQWGVTNYRDDGIGHCAFSKSEVVPPEEGLVYE
jgi:hypothetical protein